MELRERGVYHEEYTLRGERVVVVIDQHHEERFRGTVPAALVPAVLPLLWAILHLIDPTPLGPLSRVPGIGKRRPPRPRSDGRGLRLLP